jgi:hypothetical protein
MAATIRSSFMLIRHLAGLLLAEADVIIGR